MDHLSKLKFRLRWHITMLIVLENAIILELWWINGQHFHLPDYMLLVVLGFVGLVSAGAVAALILTYAMEPVEALWQAILHISPVEHAVAAPKLDKLHFGRELVRSLSDQVYQLASQQEEKTADKETVSPTVKFVAQNLPLPVLILDSKQNVVDANHEAAEYLGKAEGDIVGAHIYTVLNMSFTNGVTLDQWLGDVSAHKAIATSYWEKVRLNDTLGGKQAIKQFDMAAYYNKDNADKLETMLVLFDHSEKYQQEDANIGLLELSVHELRTPLTLLRGYIEVFQEELAGQVSAELGDFMVKMQVAAQQMTNFVNNMLNFARVDGEQLQLTLQEEDWPPLLKMAVDSMVLRARVRGVELEFEAPLKLPAVAADPISIQEVVINLIDNAIKYSGDSHRVKITAGLTKEGLVETTVQDWGVGISTNLLPNLFTKFYRDHHNRTHVSGTGLGLYLSKLIVTAHGGNIWVRSSEGHGTTMGFTLLPYSQLPDDQKVGPTGSDRLVRSAHGWIKNHSMSRR